MSNEFENQNPLPPRYPLAYDVNGTPFVPPPQVIAWRVFRLPKKGAGRPMVMRDAGKPLELSLTAGFDDLTQAVGESGRYRLEGIDADGRPVPGCVAVTEVVFDDDPEDQPKKADVLLRMVDSVEKLVACNITAMQAMASAFGPVRPAMPAPTVVVDQPSQPPQQQQPNLMDMLGNVAKGLEVVKAFKTGPAPTPAAPPEGAKS